MNKLFTTIFLLLGVTIGAHAQKFYLEAIESQMDFDNFRFFYDDKDRLDVYLEEEDFGGAEKGSLAFSFQYNDLGEQTSMMGYQKLATAQGEQYVNTMKYYFLYNDKKEVSEQKNYNLDINGGFKTGGIYRYEYNDKGNVSRRWLYYEKDGVEELREITTYSYDETGKLAESITSSTWDTEENAEFESKTTYVYGDKGELVSRVGFYYNGHDWEYSVTEEFTYDEKGNIIDRLQYRSSKDNATERDTYTYTQALRSEAVLPVYVGSNFSDSNDNFVMITSPNLIDTHTAYKVSYETSALDVFDVSTYAYASERPEQSGINETMVNTEHDAEVIYYNLQGMRVDTPQHGIFIKKQGNKTTKCKI